MTPRYVLFKITPFRVAAVLFAVHSLIAMGCCGCFGRPQPPVQPPVPIVVNAEALDKNGNGAPVPNPGKKGVIDRGEKDGGARQRQVPVVPQNGRRYALLVGVTQYKPESIGLENLFYPRQ